jgi:hypothetical protein
MRICIITTFFTKLHFDLLSIASGKKLPDLRYKIELKSYICRIIYFIMDQFQYLGEQIQQFLLKFSQFPLKQDKECNLICAFKTKFIQRQKYRRKINDSKLKINTRRLFIFNIVIYISFLGC